MSEEARAIEEEKVSKPVREGGIKAIIYGGILLLLLLIVAIFVVINLLEMKAVKSYSWYDDFDISLTSYEDTSYGTFFCTIKLNLAYEDEAVRKEISAKKAQIVDIIRTTLSEQNYYRINNNMKLQYNLTPLLRERINRILSRGGIKDISYPFIRLMLHERNDSLVYQDIGTYDVNINGYRYEMQLYVVYDGSSSLFTKELDKNKVMVVDTLKPYLGKVSMPNPEEKLIRILENKLENIFSDIESKISRENPYYKVSGYFRNVYVGYFVRK